MTLAPKTIPLRDGREAILRSTEPTTDAAALIDYLKTAAGETEFLILYPEECTMTVEREIATLTTFNDAPDRMMLVCTLDGRIVGNCQLVRMPRVQTAHRATVGLALVRDVWGQGIGTAMLTELIAVAEQWGVRQLELEYVAGNERGRSLYEKMGFTAYARRPAGVRLRDGSYRDEILMLRQINI